MIAELLFKAFGTTHTPSAHRHDFMHKADLYQKASEIAKRFEDLQYFFTQHPNLLKFDLTPDSERKFANVQYSTPPDIAQVIIIQKSINTTLDDIQVSLAHLGNIEVNRDNVRELMMGAMTPEQQEVFVSVENYEKNKLEEMLPRSSAQTIHKL